MRPRLRHRVPVVLATTALLAGTGGAAAFALVGSDDPVRSGNDQPLDDNHATPSVVGPAVVVVTDDAPAHDVGDDQGADDPATHDVGDDHGTATRSDDRRSRSGSSGSGASTSSGSSSDDGATHDATDDSGHGSDSGSGSDDSGHGSDDGGHGSDDGGHGGDD